MHISLRGIFRQVYLVLQRSVTLWLVCWGPLYSTYVFTI